MHVFGAFELEVRPGTPDLPAAVKIALLRYTRGEDGRLFIIPECASFEEIEGQINSLQDELDELREKGPPSVPGCIVRGFSSSPASVSSRANPLEIAG